jgi:hypothetical protein
VKPLCARIIYSDLVHKFHKTFAFFLRISPGSTWTPILEKLIKPIDDKEAEVARYEGQSVGDDAIFKT